MFRQIVIELLENRCATGFFGAVRAGRFGRLVEQLQQLFDCGDLRVDVGLEQTGGCCAFRSGAVGSI